MAYTTIDKPTDYFNTVLYTGDGTSPRSITGVGFQPDWNWSKSRSSADYDHLLADSVRGTSAYYLKSNSTGGETGNPAAGYLSSFDSDGYTLTSGASNNTNYNASSVTYVSWNWLAGGTASSNTDGSITSSVSANTTAGFSIVSYDGNSTAGATVGHGLNSAPELVILRNRDVASSWWVWGELLGNVNIMELQSTSAAYNPNGNYHNDTMPTSSVISIGSDGQVSGSGQSHICYAFHSVKGYSKIGSYTGNGSTDGPFIYTGFKPAFVLQKNTSVTQGWQLQDNKREGYNGDNDLLQPHSNAAESGVNRIDILSNGFKVITTDAGQNSSGQTYIYMCFAESPFTTSTGIPTTAR